jgi:hypothetical protein
MANEKAYEVKRTMQRAMRKTSKKGDVITEHHLKSNVPMI